MSGSAANARAAWIQMAAPRRLPKIFFLDRMTSVIPHSDPMRKPRAPARGFFLSGRNETRSSHLFHRWI